MTFGLVLEWALALTLCCIAFIAWLWDRRTYGFPAVLTLITLDLALGFGVGGIYYFLNSGEARVIVSSQAVITATVLGLLGSVSLVIGHVAPRRLNGLRRLGDSVEKRLALSDSLPSILILELLGWGARVQQLAAGTYFHIREGSGTGVGAGSVIVTLLATLPTLAALLCFAGRWSMDRRAGALWMLPLVETAWFLPAGARAPIVGLILGMLVLRGMLGKDVNKVALVAAIGFSVTILFPFVVAYRGNDSSYSENVDTSASHALRSTFAGHQGLVAEGMDSTLSRFSDVLSTAVVIQLDPVLAAHPGDSFLDYALTAAVPRFVLPNKPDPGTYGNEFGRHYGLVRDTDSSTSIAVSQPLHAYIEGGWLLVPFAGVMSGFLYRCVSECMLTGAARVRSVIMASFAFATATSVGTIWPLGFVGLIKAMSVTVVCLLLSGGTISLVVSAVRIPTKVRS